MNEWLAGWAGALSVTAGGSTGFARVGPMTPASGMNGRRGVALTGGGSIIPLGALLKAIWISKPVRKVLAPALKLKAIWISKPVRKVLAPALKLKAM